MLSLCYTLPLWQTYGTYFFRTNETIPLVRISVIQMKWITLYLLNFFYVCLHNLKPRSFALHFQRNAN